MRHRGTAHRRRRGRLASAVVGHEGVTAPWRPMIPGPGGARSRWLTYRSAPCSSTGAPGPPPRTCGPLPGARRSGIPATSMTGSRPSRPATASHHPRGHHRPVPARRHRLPAAARRAAHHRADDLAAPRPASLDARRGGHGDRAVPPPSRRRVNEFSTVFSSAPCQFRTVCGRSLGLTLAWPAGRR